MKWLSGLCDLGLLSIMSYLKAWFFGYKLIEVLWAGWEIIENMEKLMVPQNHVMLYPYLR